MVVLVICQVAESAKFVRTYRIVCTNAFGTPLWACADDHKIYSALQTEYCDAMISDHVATPHYYEASKATMISCARILTSA